MKKSAFLMFTSILSISLFAASNVYAQDAISPLKNIQDQNGLNVTTGKITIPMPTLSIPAAPRLSISKVNELSVFIDRLSYSGGMDDRATYTIQLGEAERGSYQCVDDDCVDSKGSGSVLYPYPRIFYKKGSEAAYYFDNKQSDFKVKISATTYKYKSRYYLSRIEYKDGEVLTYTYETFNRYVGSDLITEHRPVKISSNTGYYLKISYINAMQISGWGPVSEMAIYSDGDPNTPLAKKNYGNGTVTDMAGNEYKCVSCSMSIGDAVEVKGGSYTLPGDSTPYLDVTHNNQYPFVASIKKVNSTWNYTYNNVHLDPSTSEYKYDSLVATDPLGRSTTYGFEQRGSTAIDSRVFNSVTDPNGNVTMYQNTQHYRLAKITYPEGNSESVQYDQCGNITSKTITAKPGSGANTITSMANYNDYLQNFCEVKNAGVPNWTKDANCNVTNYSYNVDGFLTEILRPADASGIRKKTIFEYEQNPLVRKVVERECGENSTCGTASEKRTQYTYWNNTFLPKSIRRVDLSTDQYLETNINYDLAGRKISEDGPRTDVDDITYYTYDILGRLIFEIGPDPDGGGTAKRQIVKHYYEPDGMEYRTETGVGNATDGSDFQWSSAKKVTFDAANQPIKTEVVVP